MNIHPINQKILLHTKLFDVEAIQMELPNHKQHTYNLVSHADSVTILPIDDQGGIHWVKQYRVGASMEMLELPAGVMDAGESPLECAQREIQEEIGMKAAELLPLGSYYLAPGYCSEVNHAFLARGLSQSQLNMDEDEFIAIRIIPVEESYQLAQKGKIKDAKSLASLLLARPYLSG